MQYKNLILFVVVCAIVIPGWFWLGHIYNPPSDSKKDEKKLAKADDKKTPVEPKKANEKDKSEPKEKTTPEKKIEPKAKTEPEKKEPAKKEPPAPVVKTEPLVTETLGGDGFHLTASLTSRGAGVRSVTLNRFKAADWHGRPVAGDLELVQADDFAPSYRMYHYQDTDDDRPVFGLGDLIWKFEGKETKDDRQSVSFSTTVPGMDHVKIVKTYRLAPKDYHVTLQLAFHNLGAPKDARVVPFRYQLVGAHGLPIEGEWYASTFRNSYIGMVDPGNRLWRKLEDSARISVHRGGDRFPAGKRDDNWLQYAGVANQYFAALIVVDNEQPKRADGGVEKESILAWARPTNESLEVKGAIGKIAKDKSNFLFTENNGKTVRCYLLPRVVKHLEDLDLVEGSRVSLSYYETRDGRRIATWLRLGETPRPQFDDITMRVQSEVVNLQPHDPVVHQFMLYHGPVKAALLSQFNGEKEVPQELVDRYTHTLHLRTLTDYPSDNWFGWFSSKIMLTDLIILFTRLMHWLLNLLHYVFGYGLSIVVLTLMVRGAMFPISRKQALFSIRMQELAPELKKVQEKHADDPAAKMQATQEFYRKHGINPLGSCWPMFLQMPIFLGLYFALQESIHFRLADFLWIKSLSAPDMLLWWTESIPYISVPDNLGGVVYLGPYLNILPVIAAALMLVQQIQTMPPPTDEQTAMQQKMMKWMVIIFGVMFYKVAAGLCMYFIASSLWGVAERKLLPKKQTSPGVPPEAASHGGGKAVITPKGKLAKNAKKEPEPETAFTKLKSWWQEVLRQAEKK